MEDYTNEYKVRVSMRVCSDRQPPVSHRWLTSTFGAFPASEASAWKAARQDDRSGHVRLEQVERGLVVGLGLRFAWATSDQVAGDRIAASHESGCQRPNPGASPRIVAEHADCPVMIVKQAPLLP